MVVSIGAVRSIVEVSVPPLLLILALGMAPVRAQDPAGSTVRQADAGTGVQDPWEGFNRSIFAFNETFDRYAFKPVAQAYRKVMPELAVRAVSNFFANLGEPLNLINNLLQGKPEDALTSGGRFVFNTTFGLAGLIDVATTFELPEQSEDFGQTLGYWGAGSGPFLMLPFLGPSTVRDITGVAVQFPAPGLLNTVGTPQRYYFYGTRAVDVRAQFLALEGSMIEGDRYRLMRNGYLQQRQFTINDGQVYDTFSSDDNVMLDDF